MNKLYEIREMLCRELDDMSSSGRLSTGDLEVIDKLTHSIKSIDTINAMEDAYSSEGYSDRNYDYARGRGRNARRDSMGRYSRNYDDDGYSRYPDRHSYAGSGKEEMVSHLRRMLGDAPDERTRNAIMTALNQIEK